MSDESARTSGDPDAPANRRLSGWTILAALAVAIGLGLRIADAWIERYTPNMDWGIGALMIRHMVRGVDFPVFFYGQPYMGNVEGALSAVLCRLTGLAVSGFMVNLGTVLVGALLLPLLYVFGRDAGSRRAGFMAVLYCTVGSDTFFHYAVSSRLAYMTLLTGGLSTLWLACWIAARPAAAGPAPWRWYVGMGLAAGVGWWGHQLVVVFFLAAAAVLLARFRWRLPSRGLGTAAAGFFLGGLPWWVWNARHDWRSFDFASSLGKVPFREGLASCRDECFRVVEAWPLGQPLNALRLALLVLAAVVFVTALVRDRRRDPNDGRFWFRLAICLVPAGLALVYSTSHYARMHATRYVLPVVPAVALLAGLGCDRLPSLRRLPWEWVILAILIPPHAWQLGAMGNRLPQDRAAWRLARDLAREVAPLCDDRVCLGDYVLHWINFASDETLCVAAPPGERYAPYARRAELAGRPAILDRYRDLHLFLATTAATSSVLTVDGLRVDYGLTPPTNAWDYLSAGLVTAIRDGEGHWLGAALQDGAIDSGWAASAARESPASLIVGFAEARPVCGLRLLSPDERYPPLVRVEGQAEATDTWTVLVPTTPLLDYFWSGPYPKIGWFQFHEELRWNVPNGGVRRLRITCTPDRRDKTAPVDLGEVLIMERATAPDGALPGADTVAGLLRESGVGQVFAPRWLAGALAARSDKSYRVYAPRVFDRGVQDLTEHDSSCPWPVILDRPTALIMDRRDAPRSRAVLAARGLTWQEAPLGSCTALLVAVPPAGHDAARFPELGWTETGCYGLHSAAYAKRKAQVLYEAGEARLKQDADRARELFARALAACPTHQPARRALAQALAAAGLAGDAARERAVLAGQTEPRSPAAASFADGIEFLGVTVSTQRVQRGRAFDVAYFWRCRPAARPGRLAVFVHVVKGDPRPRFQDDHVLLDSIPGDDFLCQPYEGEVFTEHRTIAVPPGAEPGTYRILLGLVDRASRGRLKVRTTLEQHQRAITLPVPMEIVP